MVEDGKEKGREQPKAKWRTSRITMTEKNLEDEVEASPSFVVSVLRPALPGGGTG